MKKMYYIIDNGDMSVTVDLIGLTDTLEAEATDYNEDSNKEDEPQWNIQLVWMTEEEFNNLPEAY